MPDNDWTFTANVAGWPVGAQLYELMTVAHEWNTLPSALGICEPDDDLALMREYIRAKRLMSAYETHLQNEESKKRTKPKAKSKGGGSSSSRRR